MLSGEVRATLGPIETLFTGEGTMAYDEADRRAEISGEGHDKRTGSRLSARAVLKLRDLDCEATRGTLAIEYTLRGPLAQFARGGVVRNSRRRSPRLPHVIWRHGFVVRRRRLRAAYPSAA